jgi:hypothetical protein
MVQLIGRKYASNFLERGMKLWKEEGLVWVGKTPYDPPGRGMKCWI